MVSLELSLDAGLALIGGRCRIPSLAKAVRHADTGVMGGDVHRAQHVSRHLLIFVCKEARYVSARGRALRTSAERRDRHETKAMGYDLFHLFVLRTLWDEVERKGLARRVELLSSRTDRDVDRTMRASFMRVEQAVRYRRWVLDQVRPWLGQRILEIGCGVGNITTDLLDRKRVVAIDIEGAYLQELGRRLGPRPNLRLLEIGLDEEGLVEQVEAEELDSALLLNVLEHIEHDVAALENLSRALTPGAMVILQVPAHRWLYGESDRSLGHIRRYGVEDLRLAMLDAGLTVERIWQFNALGVLGWFVSGRLRREPMFSERQLRLYETLVPLLRLIEPWQGVPLGLSIMAVGRTPSSIQT